MQTLPKSIAKILLWVRANGLGQASSTLGFTLWRAWQDRKYRRAEAARMRTPKLAPGQLLGTEATLSGARFRFEGAGLQIDFLAPDLSRISWEPGAPPVPYALAKTDWSPVQTSLGEAFEGWRLASQALQILVQRDGALQFIDAGGSLLRDELPPQRQGSPEESAWSCQARLRPEEHLYGLGEQAGPFNLRGARRRIWNTDPGGSYGPSADLLYMPTPTYLALHQDGSYLIFYENSFPAEFVLGGETGSHEQDAPDTSQVSFDGGMLRYYFIPGPPPRALERFTQLTGRPELPPLWSLGYHQSRWGYKNESDIREVAAGFKEHALPLSAIHLDIDYMRGFRVFTVDPQRFPDLAALAAELDGQGIKLVTIIDPGVKVDREYSVYQQGLKEAYFCTTESGKPVVGMVWPGKSVYPDFTDPKVRAWWGELYRPLIEAGVAGIWHDMNEPTSFAVWGGLTLPLTTRHKLEGGGYTGDDHRQAHNLYGLQMNRAGFEGLRKHRPERRPWLLSRSGWVSQQRYAWNWSGDSESTWEGLRMTLATVLGQGLSGLPYTGPDIGGFSGDPSGELYVRWLQLATFLPFFRTHSSLGAARREPWVYGEPYTSIVRRYLQLRYKLLPYLYTLAWQTSQTGYPLVRPLFWSDPEDRRLWDVEDAFLLGDALLVAPILSAARLSSVEYRQSRSLRLPAGRWHSLWDEAIHQGPGVTELHATLEDIPVFVRAGSLLPMVEEGNLHLHFYAPEPDSEHASERQPTPQMLYSDSGDGYGERRLDCFQIQSDGKQLRITRQSEGEYPFPYHHIILHLHGLQAQRAWVDDKPAPLHGNIIECEPFQIIRIEA